MKTHYLANAIVAISNVLFLFRFVLFKKSKWEAKLIMLTKKKRNLTTFLLWFCVDEINHRKCSFFFFFLRLMTLGNQFIKSWRLFQFCTWGNDSSLNERSVISVMFIALLETNENKKHTIISKKWKTKPRLTCCCREAVPGKQWSSLRWSQLS